jgi:hypothetical protein
MDAIDITDSAFSLDATDANMIFGGSSINDYTMFIYIGAAILIIIIGMFIYNFYQNKKNSENQGQELDCERGFCTMEQSPADPSQYSN